jgi:hypothetical protein
MTDDNAEERRPWHRRFLAEARDMVVEEAIDRVVDEVSGGWLGYDGGDDDEDDRRPGQRKPARRETFEDRLERELAQLSRDAERGADNGSMTRPAIEQQQRTAQTFAPQLASAPARFRPAAPQRAFGRKTV